MSTDKNNDDNIIEQLPGDIRKIAEVVGVEPALKLAKAFRGTYLYIHNLDDILREIRNKEIRKSYNKGRKVRDLAIKHRLTERQILNILGTEPEEETLLPLLSLIKATQK